MFPPTSRYYTTPTAKFETADDREVVYLRRRFVPSSARFTTITEHVVTDGERLDQIAAHYLGDPEQFWRICDANDAVRPEELVEIGGRRLRITLPEGLVSANA